MSIKCLKGGRCKGTHPLICETHGCAFNLGGGETKTHAPAAVRVSGRGARQNQANAGSSPAHPTIKISGQEQLRQELLAVMWRYSQESNVTVMETIRSAHQAAERIAQIAMDRKDK